MHEPRVAVVTGGTGGIGRAIVERLLVDGWSVVATYQSNEEAAAIFAASHANLAVIQANAASGIDCQRTIEHALDRFGGLHHLVANAAINRDAPLVELSDSDWDAVIATNLSGVFRLMRAALPAVTLSGHGRIVAISSVAATMGNATQGAYAASKAGLVGLTATLAREVAHTGTTVNLVVPGPTSGTGMTAMADPKFVAAMERKIPMQRLGSPREVAHVVRFLLDDDTSFTTGSSITVDGGLSM